MLKKFLIIFTCGLSPYYTLAINDQNSSAEKLAAINETTNSICCHDFDKNSVSSSENKNLGPYDVVININNPDIDNYSPISNNNLSYNHSSPSLQLHSCDYPIEKNLGVISAIGEQITEYKVGDIIGIEKLIMDFNPYMEETQSYDNVFLDNKDNENGDRPIHLSATSLSPLCSEDSFSSEESEINQIEQKKIK